jgi:hypothetical protein
MARMGKCSRDASEYRKTVVDEMMEGSQRCGTNGLVLAVADALGLLVRSRNNKFYSVQLIQESGNYFVFRKWGRVGPANPQVNCTQGLCIH